jgi:hypothetical protein
MRRLSHTFLFVALLLLTLLSCDDKLSEINENPNASEHPQPAYLLSAAEYHSAKLYMGGDMNYNSTLLWVQHWAKIQYTEPDCYNVSNSSFSGIWDEAYATIIADLNTILASNLSNDNEKAVATIWRSWTFLQLTNLYGDIPYREFGKSVTPAYDTQEDVLRGLLSELADAAASLRADGGRVDGDLIYGGNLARWKQLAQSLRLRIALEIADRDATTARQIMAELYADRSSLIGSNADNALFVFTNSPQWNPWADAFSTRDDQRMSKTLIDRLKALDDPRLPIYAQLPDDPTVTTYEGGGNSLSADQANSQGFSKLSKPGRYFLADNAPAVFFTYAEINFIFAEAAARGLIRADAAQLYNAGVEASLSQYGVGDKAREYLQQSGVAFDGSRWAERIGWQKWISYYGQAPDAFTDWRRLGYPRLVAGPSSVLDGGQLPRRVFYPVTEQSLNGESYRTAISRQGADELTTRLWFDVAEKKR